MARKGAKSKQQLLREQYNREYRNYLNRIKRQEAQGWFGYEVIPKVKNPTQASIKRIKQVTARVIREKSSTVTSLETGEIVTPYQARKEEARRRSESAKKAAKTRKENLKAFQESFAKEYDIEEYIPNQIDIVTDVIKKDYVEKMGGTEWFRYLEQKINEAPNDPDFYKLKYNKQREHMRNADILSTKIKQILNNKMAEKIYYVLTDNGMKEQLETAINDALFAYDMEQIRSGRSLALQLLSDGALSKGDYNNLLMSTDDEA